MVLPIHLIPNLFASQTTIISDKSVRNAWHIRIYRAKTLMIRITLLIIFGFLNLIPLGFCCEKKFFLLPVSTAVSYDKSIRAIRVKVPDSDDEFLLHPATVRRNDRSAQSVVCKAYLYIFFPFTHDLCMGFLLYCHGWRLFLLLGT